MRLNTRQKRVCSSLCASFVVVATLALLAGTPPAARGANGGPDSFGYAWIDSNPPAPTVPFNWTDLTTTGTYETNWTDANDGYSGPIPLGFLFSYYGNLYNDVYIGTNGYLSFGAGFGNAPTGPLPQAGAPDNEVMAFGSDLVPGGAVFPDGVYWQTLTGPDRFVVEFFNVPLFAGPGQQTFEVILNATGEIWFQYGLLTAAPSSVGIEDGSGTVGLEYGTSVSNGLAIRFQPTNFNLDPPTGAAFSPAGTTVVYPYSVTNLQASPDTFDLTATGILGWTVEFWDAADTALLTDTAGAPSPDTGPVAPSGSFAFNVHVVIPGAANPGDIETSTITATSAGNPVAARTSVATTTADIVPPWFDDMELGPAPWWATSTGGVDEWQWGTPSVTGPPSCFSGTRCWGTDLSGTYDSGFDAALYPPPFDLTGISRVDLKITHWFDIYGDAPPASQDDGGFLEISADGGSTWNKIAPAAGVLYGETMDFGSPYPNGAVFGQQSAGWVTSTWDLSGYVGGVVQVRFRLWDDTSVGPNTAGWYIDDVSLLVPSLDLIPDTVASTSTRGATTVYPFTVTNLQASPDTFDLTATGVLGWAVEFWDAADTALLTDTAGSPVPDTGVVPALGTYLFNVHVLVSGTAFPGNVETSTIAAVSVANGLNSDTAVATTTVVAALDLWPDAAANAGAAGTVVIYPFWVQNAQSTDDTFDLVAAGVLGWTVEFWDAADTALLTDTAGSPDPDTGVITPSSWFALNIHVLIPGTANPTDVESSTITAVSVANAINADTSFVTTTVMPALDLLPGSAAGAGLVGTAVVYAFSVTNLQASPDTFDLTATSVLGWTVEFWDAADTALLTDTAGSSAPDTGVVPAFSTVTFNVHVLIPGTANPRDLETTTILASSVAGPSSTDSSWIDTTAMSPPVTAPWFDDLELGPSPWWASSTGGVDEWQWGTPSVVGPASCASGAACWGTDLSGTYDTGFDASLYPPPFDLTAAGQVNLTFTHWYDIYGDSPPSSLDDGGFLEISTDGGVSWSQLFPASGQLYDETMDSSAPYNQCFGQQSAGWVTSVVDLTPWTGGIVQVRFRLWDDTSVGPNTAGWYIDDVSLSAPGSPPVLQWTGGAGYTTDGLEPQVGLPTTPFTYRIGYRDADNDAAVAGSPRVHILDTGVEIAGSPFSMTFATWAGAPNDFIAGAFYVFTRTLPLGTNYAYYFTATDASGSAVSFPSAAVNAPDVTATINRAPAANAGPDQSVYRNAVVTLDGTGSSDPDADPLTYSWAVVSGPAAVLNPPNSPTPAFIARDAGTYVLRLTVRDGSGATARDEVSIVVTNRAPVIGLVSPVSPLVTLPVSASQVFQVNSTDPDGDALTYAWTVNGQTVGSGAFAYSFDAAAPGTYDINVTVSDGVGTRVQSWTVTVTVAPAGVGGALLWIVLAILLIVVATLLLLFLFLRRRKKERWPGVAPPPGAAPWTNPPGAAVPWTPPPAYPPAAPPPSQDGSPPPPPP